MLLLSLPESDATGLFLQWRMSGLLILNPIVVFLELGLNLVNNTKGTC